MLAFWPTLVQVPYNICDDSDIASDARAAISQSNDNDGVLGGAATKYHLELFVLLNRLGRIAHERSLCAC